MFVICLYLDLFHSVLHMDINMAWTECVCYMSISCFVSFSTPRGH